jgi:RNA polymerase sigma-70 factor (ECF subfamily)
MQPSGHDAADDASLVRAITRAAPGIDGPAEAELCRRLAPRIRLYGLRHLRNQPAASDLVQQVLLMTLEKLRASRLREPEKLGSFVLGTCRLVVLELRRGTARREALLRTYGITECWTEPAEPRGFDEDKIAQCMTKLSQRERSVLVLSFFGDRSAEEVGQELGLSSENTRVIRHRALRKLRDYVTGNEGAS